MVKRNFAFAICSMTIALTASAPWSNDTVRAQEADSADVDPNGVHWVHSMDRFRCGGWPLNCFIRDPLGVEQPVVQEDLVVQQVGI